MTSYEKKIIQLSNKIIKTIPKLKDLQKGCIIKYNSIRREVINIKNFNNKLLLDVFDNVYGHDYIVKENNSFYKIINNQQYKINVKTVGHEP